MVTFDKNPHDQGLVVPFNTLIEKEESITTNDLTRLPFHQYGNGYDEFDITTKGVFSKINVNNLKK